MTTLPATSTGRLVAVAALTQEVNGTMSTDLWRLLVLKSPLRQAVALATDLAARGARCWATSSPDRALHIADTEPGIKCVIVDDRGDDELLGFFMGIRRSRPDLSIVGTGTPGRRARFQQIGIFEFIPEPVEATALARLVAGLQRRPERIQSIPVGHDVHSGTYDVQSGAAPIEWRDVIAREGRPPERIADLFGHGEFNAVYRFLDGSGGERRYFVAEPPASAG